MLLHKYWWLQTLQPLACNTVMSYFKKLAFIKMCNNISQPPKTTAMTLYEKFKTSIYCYVTQEIKSHFGRTVEPVFLLFSSDVKCCSKASRRLDGAYNQMKSIIKIYSLDFLMQIAIFLHHQSKQSTLKSRDYFLNDFFNCSGKWISAAMNVSLLDVFHLTSTAYDNK